MNDMKLQALTAGMQKARTFHGAGSFFADREGEGNKYAYRRKGTETA